MLFVKELVIFPCQQMVDDQVNKHAIADAHPHGEDPVRGTAIAGAVGDNADGHAHGRGDGEGEAIQNCVVAAAAMPIAALPRRPQCQHELVNSDHPHLLPPLLRCCCHAMIKIEHLQNPMYTRLTCSNSDVLEGA